MPAAVGNGSVPLSPSTELLQIVETAIQPLADARGPGASQALADAAAALLNMPAAIATRTDDRWRIEAVARSRGVTDEDEALQRTLPALPAQLTATAVLADGAIRWMALPLHTRDDPSRALLLRHGGDAGAPRVSQVVQQLASTPLVAGARAVTRRATRILRRTYRFSRTLADTGRAHQHQLIVDGIAHAARARLGTLLLMDTTAGMLSVVAASGYPAALLAELQIAPGIGIVGSVYSRGRPILVTDVTTLGRKPRPRYRTRSFIAMPLRAAHQVLGVVCVADRLDDRPFDRTDVSMVRAMLAPAVLAVERERALTDLEAAGRSAALDPLTGVLSRQQFWRALQGEMERARRHGLELSVLMLDLDEFKQVNDVYGHLVGDAVLREIGEVFRRSIRAFDVCARYGGDEFVIILPASGAEQALRSARRIARAVENRWSVVLGTMARARVTVSVGAAVLRGSDQPMDLVARADRALYTAKMSGRNTAFVGEDC